jgi:hypothetical protein
MTTKYILNDRELTNSDWINIFIQELSAELIKKYRDDDTFYNEIMKKYFSDEMIKKNLHKLLWSEWESVIDAFITPCPCEEKEENNAIR